MRRFRLLILLLCMWGVVVAGDCMADATCHDSGFLTQGRAFSDLCWECFFPIRIVGVPIGIGSRGSSKLPDDAAAPICVCPGRWGYPSPGFTLGYWSPDHVIELVREPMCSPVFGGVKLSYGGNQISTPAGNILGTLEMGGGGAEPTTSDTSDVEARASYNFHWIKFPGAMLLNYVVDIACAPKANNDMDFAYLTELDPTWQDEELSLYTAPETNLFANLYTHASCIFDGVAATYQRPIRGFWWCAGTWGPIYPMASNQPHSAEFDAQMLTAMKGLAHMHRFGLATLKYGDTAVCAEQRWFILPHEQYQLQNFWPMPERGDAHWPGTSFWLWGLGRTEPVVGEDRVVMEWAYHECCITLW